MLDLWKSDRAERTRSVTASLISKPPCTAPKPNKNKVASITPGSITPAKRGHDDASRISMATPVLEFKPAAVFTPTTKKLPPSLLEQRSPLNPLLPSLEYIQQLLLEQLFEWFKGKTKLFFSSQVNVNPTLSCIFGTNSWAFHCLSWSMKVQVERIRWFTYVHVVSSIPPHVRYMPFTKHYQVTGRNAALLATALKLVAQVDCPTQWSIIQIHHQEPLSLCFLQQVWRRDTGIRQKTCTWNIKKYHSSRWS